jgi:hypothetical protein
MQALEAVAESAGASGDDAKEDGKKKLAQKIASAADDQQWNAFMPTDAVQDCSAAEQKRILVERGQELFNAPEEAMDEYDGMACYVNDCDALLAFMEAKNGAEGGTMMGTDAVALGDHVDKDVVLGEELHSMRYEVCWD